MDINTLQALNKDLMIKDISDPAFLTYGRILPFSIFEDYHHYLDQKTSIPEVLNQYIADDQNIHNIFPKHTILSDIFGDVSLEFGYVNGHNLYLNALEFHPSPEINISVTPFVLFLGHTKDIKDYTYDIHNIEVFFIPAHTAMVIYPTTLHFSPCKVSDEGFKCGVILPYGTNMDMISAEEKIKRSDPLLYKTYKWLIAHPDYKNLIHLGAYPGLIGKNLKIEYK